MRSPRLAAYGSRWVRNRIRISALAHDSRRDAGGNHAAGNRLGDHRAGADDRLGADVDARADALLVPNRFIRSGRSMNRAATRNVHAWGDEHVALDVCEADVAVRTDVGVVLDARIWIREAGAPLDHGVGAAVGED